jgi:hypothetical protein
VEAELLKRLFFLIVVFCCAAAQRQTPERTVTEQVITSAHDPAAQITLPENAKYAGADRWDLYEIADCELHAFVETGPEKNVKTLYWVQFEGYLPSRPELRHTYNSPRHETIGGYDFFVDTWVRANDAEITPGSDREHIENIVRAKGYQMPAGMMYVRLVHLLDESKRKELMIIYGEDIAPTKFSVKDLDEGGQSHDKWAAIENSLIERAKKKIAIEPLARP